jgi:hypothetical protein
MPPLPSCVQASSSIGHLLAAIDLAVPGRPIGPWSRRTGAPEASATGRDRTLGPYWVPGAPGPQGHERSPTVKRNHRSTSLQLKQLARRQLADQIVLPKVREFPARRATLPVRGSSAMRRRTLSILKVCQ